jgi:iron(III) transport system substrate-binding protein
MVEEKEGKAMCPMRYLLWIAICFLTFVVRMAVAQDIPALRDAKDSAERTRIQTLIDGARSEGKLEWVGVMIEPAHAKYILDKFKAYYGLPNLVTQYTYSNTAQIITNVEQLMKAKKNNFDIVWNTSWAWYKDLVARGKMMRYDSPKYKEYTLSNRAGFSNPGYWVADAYSFSPMYNPKALSKAGFKNFKPTSWWDFADAKFAKLVSMDNISQSISTSQTAIGLRKALGLDWFKKLAKDVKPALYNKTAQGREWVASGEYPITMTSHAKNAAVVRKEGASVELVYPREGVVLLPFSPVILAEAPHLNVAKLFIDYVRSSAGANTVVDSGSYLFFGRPGVKTLVPDLLPPWEKLNLIAMNWDVDGSEESIQDIQKMCVDIGLCH